LAKHEVVQIKVRLAQQERDRYNQLIQLRNNFYENPRSRLAVFKVGSGLFKSVRDRKQDGERCWLIEKRRKLLWVRMASCGFLLI
jgi:hypothetical protein